MAEFLNESSHIARKEYCCVFCNDIIKKGERYTAWTFADGGRVTTDKYHPNCAYAIQQNCDYGDEDYSTYGVMEPINEQLRENGITPAATIHEAVNQWCESIKIA